MKFLPLLLLIVVVSCGPNAAEVSEQIRIQDSIRAAQLDSMATAKKIEELQAKYVAIDSSKNELQKKFDAELTRLDSLTGYNNELEGKLNKRTSEISKLKGEIASLLKRPTPTPAERTKAQALLIELNEKVDDLIKAASRAK